jgi:AbrB family looped-hinge helix DNA binding protein
MKEISTTMTQRGQVTVPSEVRRLLGLKPRDKVTFAIEEDVVTLTPARFTVQSSFASVKPLRGKTDFKRISREARDDKLKRDRSKLP